MKLCLLLAGLLWTATVLGQTPASAPSPEAKLVNEMYGERIAQALASPDAADNVALGREMMLAGSDSSHPAGLRHLLALEVVKLCARAGTDESYRLAKDALGLADKLVPLPAMDKAKLQVQMAQQRLDAVRKVAATAKELADLTEEVVGAELALARALLAEEKVEQATATANSAAAKARNAKLDLLEGELADLGKEIKLASARIARVRGAEAQLQRAKDAGDAEAARAARQKLGLVYLLADGDIAKANSYLVGTGDANELAVAAVAAFKINPKVLPPPDKAAEYVDALGKAAASAENKPAQARLAKDAAAFCQGFLATAPQGLPATKARMLLVQLQALSAENPGEKLLAKLKANYKGLGAKMEALPEGVVKFSYDFTSKKMLGDWEVKSGAWEVIGGRDVLAATPDKYQHINLDSRLRFRADKPLTLSFKASGTSDLTGYLYFDTTWTHDVSFELGAQNNGVSQIRDDYSTIFSDRRLRIDRGTVYKIDINWDGQKTFSWTVNGQNLAKTDMKYRVSDVAQAVLYVGLKTAGYPAAFDDVVIQGTVLEDPSSLPTPTSRRVTPPIIIRSN